MALAEGDRVAILGLPDGFLEGLPAAEAEFMREAVGGPAKVYRMLEGNMVELFFADPASGAVHFAILPENLVSPS